MQTKYLTKELLKELIENDTYYYLEGSCPELMKFPRLLEYANNILNNNRSELPDFILESEAYSFEGAKKIIDWFGEDIYLVKMPEQSVEFILEEDL